MHRDLEDVRHTKAEPELIWFDKKNKVFSYALQNLIGNVALSDNVSYDFKERVNYEQKYESALKQFELNLPETFSAFKELIAFIVLAKRPGFGGGTVSNRIGLIWLAPEMYWTDDDWLENLVHEFIHNALFLEDMVNTVFTAGGSRLGEEDALAMSAIRQVKRGYDKAYHSAFVSYGLIEHYLWLNKKDKAIKFIDPLVICVEDLVKNTNFITKHGEALLFELAEQVVEIRAELT